MSGSGLPPTVSVVIPTFNALSTLKLALASLFAQSFRDWQAIIVDDGSSDDTWAFLQALDDCRIKCLRNQANMGRGAARQLGLEASRSQFVAFLDADDIYHPEKLSLQVQFMHRHADLAFCATGVASFDQGQGLRSVRRHAPREIRIYDPYAPMGFSPASTMLRRSAIGTVRFDPRYREVEDLDFFNKAFSGSRYEILPDLLYFYREFAGANYRKVLRGHLGSVRIRAAQLSLAQPASVKVLARGLLRLTLVALVLPLVGADRLVARRGRAASREEIKEFEDAIAIVERSLLN
ncbi:MAG: glycosyltransferase family 2 protein [Wenzhouxiangella sp.]|nr:glycosyltransferase family 2 protein [Wenzhouxiangella sp.]